MEMHAAYVGLGSNLGDPAANVEQAMTALAQLGTVTKRSSLYKTKPWGNRAQPDFVNAAVLLETPLAAADLLAALKTLEKRLGRVDGERWGPRAIDLDLLTYDDLEIDEPGLRVPHPQLFERAFVLAPLAEIDARYGASRDALPCEELAGVAVLS